MRSGRNSDPPLLQAQQVRDNFSVHKWGNGERLLLAARVGLSFPDMTFADLQFVCLLSFTDAPEDDLAIWVGIISLHVKHLLLPQGFDSPVGPSSLGSGLSFA